MPLFQLNNELIFPPVHYAEGEGLLAIGGDLSVERLLLAYSQGIFPWYSDKEPIMWWSPDPRMVLLPNELHVSKSMRSVLNKKKFTITYDTAFEQVITGCGKAPRVGQKGTWITKEMRNAYINLHKAGYAHSVEAWVGDTLSGGLYGVRMGNCFFGESMFSDVENASKAAFITFVRKLVQEGCELIDCQVYTEHLESLGAKEIQRKEFMRRLKDSQSL